MKATARFVSTSVDIEVTLGDGRAKISGGIGGWETISRPGRVDAVQWPGVGALRMQLPLLLDGFRDDRDVQPDFDTILSLGLSAEGETEPLPFTVTGPIPFSGTEWVLDSYDDGDAIVNSEGVLTRKALTLSLLEYIPAGSITFTRRRRRRRRRVHPKPQRYVVRKGDTLYSIAHREMGNRKLWKRIGKLNGIRDPGKKLKPGRVLRLPPVLQGAGISAGDLAGAGIE